MVTNRLEALLGFLKEDPEDPFIRFALASEYLKLDDTAPALETFEALVSDRPEYVGTYYHLGKLYERLERADDARKAYRDGIRVASAQGDLHSESELRGALMELEMDDDF